MLDEVVYGRKRSARVARTKLWRLITQLEEGTGARGCSDVSSSALLFLDMLWIWLIPHTIPAGE